MGGRDEAAVLGKLDEAGAPRPPRRVEDVAAAIALSRLRRDGFMTGPS